MTADTGQHPGSAPAALAQRWRRSGVRPDGLIIACGAVVRELQAVLARNGLADAFDIRAVPASYHNRPERITPAVGRLLTVAKPHYRRIFVAYADCGTGGALDRLLLAEHVERLPGAHCYAFFSGVDRFAAGEEADFGSFYLTDFLARHFDALVWRGLGLDRHPELRDLYFAHYRRVIYLSQAATPELIACAEDAANRLGLAYEHRPVGYGDMDSVVRERFAVTAA